MSGESCPSLNGLPAMDPAEMQAKSLELLQQVNVAVFARSSCVWSFARRWEACQGGPCAMHLLVMCCFA